MSDVRVSRTLENYRDLVRRFVIGDISADEFEADYLTRFKSEPNQLADRGLPTLLGRQRPLEHCGRLLAHRARAGLRVCDLSHR